MVSKHLDCSFQARGPGMVSAHFAPGSVLVLPLRTDPELRSETLKQKNIFSKSFFNPFMTRYMSPKAILKHFGAIGWVFVSHGGVLRIAGP